MGRKIFKIMGIIFSVSLLLLLVLYITLCMCVKGKEIRVEPRILEEGATISLTDEQLKIAGFTYNNSSYPEFRKYPLITDAFSRKNNISKSVAAILVKPDKYTMTEYRIIVLATSRYLVRNVDYSTLYNYYFSKIYFGNGIFGLDKASQEYFDKKWTELEPKEFITLCVISFNPVSYDIYDHKNRLDNRVKDIYAEFISGGD